MVAFFSTDLIAQEFTSIFNGKNLKGWYVYLRDTTVDLDTKAPMPMYVKERLPYNRKLQKFFIAISGSRNYNL